MRRPLLDADVFRCLRDLNLLDALAATLAPPGLLMTEYVARHELSLVDSDVRRLEAAGALEVARLLKGTPEVQRYRSLQREADKGEAECVAWALGVEAASRPVFITRDGGAERFARSKGVPVTDLLGLVAAAIRHAGLPEDTAREHLAVWHAPAIQLCRPRDYPGLDAALAERHASEATLFDIDDTVARATDA